MDKFLRSQIFTVNNLVYINWGHGCAGNIFLVPGATVATLLMLGALHARRLYDDKKVYYSLSFTYFLQVYVSSCSLRV